MKNAKWIWPIKDYVVDSYAVFKGEFEVKQNKGNILQIASDSAYVVFINDNLVSFSFCADYPTYKLFNQINIDKFVSTGVNKILIQVYYEGFNTQTYIKDNPGLIFEISNEDNVILASNENTSCRMMNEYKENYKKIITTQLGLSFLFDNTKKPSDFHNAVVVNKTLDIKQRKIAELELLGRQPVTISEVDGHYLIDLGKEVAGFIDLDIECDKEQKLLITYGEHLVDGKVRRLIHNRDFSVEFVAKIGRNKYVNYFRRLAGRYLEIYSETPIKINYCGIREVNYPVVEIKKDFGDELINRIYKTSVRTLRLCMHEHYEDCPWREQALYTMDSRNQILCGYHAFENMNKDYARHNLVLISKGLREDGLLSICYPSGNDLPIPSFSLAYIIEVIEYVNYTKDKSILDEVGYVLKTIVSTFESRIGENGMIYEFEKPFWDFYEWEDESAGNMEDYYQTPYKDNYSTILNAMFVYAMSYYKQYFNDDTNLEVIKEGIKKNCMVNNMFTINNQTKKVSQLANSLCILIGLGDEKLANEMINNKDMVQATLSMKTFYYDALLTYGDTFKDFVIEDIKENYKMMLDKGATSFWETIKGEADFDNAGSLCHGWSAIPVYYFSKLLK